jgi:hypothetical protein
MLIHFGHQHFQAQGIPKRRSQLVQFCGNVINMVSVPAGQIMQLTGGARLTQLSTMTARSSLPPCGSDGVVPLSPLNDEKRTVSFDCGNAAARTLTVSNQMHLINIQDMKSQQDSSTCVDTPCSSAPRRD